MKTFRILTFIALTAYLTLPSCVTSETKIDDLIGRWEVVNAERDGKKTESLLGIFLEFNQDGKMTTNFNEEATEVESPFNLTGNLIEQQGDHANSYTIDQLNKEGLVLRSTMMNLNFKLFLDIILRHCPGVINLNDDLTKAVGWVLHSRHARRGMGHYKIPG